MNNRNLIIFVLAVCAAVLVVLNISQPPRAEAQQAVISRDYAVVTAPIATGGDAVYILDNRSQKIAVFTYDPTTRQIRPRIVKAIGGGASRTR